ncbi:MAG: DUF2510 domain-containing protein [Acidimicrobiaceae bacterium]|nr:MAG: hypothetical protein MB53_00100 [marine actinobacterium MedAcidi-G2A]MAT01847.1 DUF2510 domain-containing protein [Acidimicrobiaceae bacterium]MBA4809481.1 DUF2510 domain-containing protein [Acidimicrobiales bacterium]MBC84552.1 DUF2510 domain-containing protein [Acidimicrobiaceae bacterium]OUV01721.1 MAG: hypothetical protein CBC37_01110 [Acidimicrobiaceae bacterium TMED77]
MIRPEFPPPPLLDKGWYADPTGRYEARFWDGKKWTSHISHYGATGTDPIMRARFDRLWIRLIGRVVLWGSVLVAIFLVVKAFWPEDIVSSPVNELSGLEFSTIQVSDGSVTLLSSEFNIEEEAGL